MGDRGQVDIAIIGDGPAGSALAAACQRLDLDVLLIGPDAPWENTYASFVDDLATPDVAALLGVDLDQVAAELFPRRGANFDAWGHRRHVIDREYGVIDTVALHAALRRGVNHRVTMVKAITPPTTRSQPWTVTGDEGEIAARVVVDATGWPSKIADTPTHRPTRPLAWQSAFGIVVAERPEGTHRPSFMDFRVVGLERQLPLSFCYVVQVHDGWLIEETVLASAIPVDPDLLRTRLAMRLGCGPAELDTAALRVERVVIPMGAPVPPKNASTVAFGAAAGLGHPATGYSVAASIRITACVVVALAAALDAPGPAAVDVGSVNAAVWPPSARRTRLLHRYGLEVLLELEPDDVRTFFDVFFDLPVSIWTPYLRVDSSSDDVASAMWQIFLKAPWRLRRRLVGSLPRSVARAASRRFRASSGHGAAD